nr:nitrate reductase subunit beta [Bacilli bacterium]
MKIKAQIAMVMNLDKCIGCHTCSVTCKNTWTNRPGAEYMWFNNVETRPGPGFPKSWEDQERFRGGWTLRNGKLQLKSGGAWQKLASIFHNPDLPTIHDYYEPWTYDYEHLINSDTKKHQPIARPKSLLTGKTMEKPVWGPNWDDDLAGGPEIAPTDPNLAQLQEEIAFTYEQAFMMYLPRICEHCLNPACVAACPSGAIYKREEDGIVLVDQEACRGWRFCVSACPYKKVYFNWNTHKAEKCHFCYPRIEAGMPTVCSETCVGRIRYLGPIFYDADRVRDMASVVDEKALYEAQLSVFLDPCDPLVIEEARKAGIREAWIEAAQRSPVYQMAVKWKVALPIHPEYRTLPMVWYVPPLSPMMQAIHEDENLSFSQLREQIKAMRIPVAYLASILSAGDETVIENVLMRLTAMRRQMQAKKLGIPSFSAQDLQSLQLTQAQIEEMARLFAVAKYQDRFVIPTAIREDQDIAYRQGACSLEGIAPKEGQL